MTFIFMWRLQNLFTALFTIISPFIWKKGAWMAYVRTGTIWLRRLGCKCRWPIEPTYRATRDWNSLCVFCFCYQFLFMTFFCAYICLTHIILFLVCSYFSRICVIVFFYLLLFSFPMQNRYLKELSTRNVYEHCIGHGVRDLEEGLY